MKASIAAVCFLVALSCVIAELSDELCRHPLPFSMCAPNSTRRIYSFFNATNQCEGYDGCDSGTNRFGSYGECINGCPYGRHHPPGGRVTGTH
uniref:Putative tick kunitz 52 n=1 Tax=Ixodes ricinus TaxID=34613 RepID=V5ICE1_IXORI